MDLAAERSPHSQSWPSTAPSTYCRVAFCFCFFFFGEKKRVWRAGCHKRKVEFVSRKGREKKQWAACLKSFIKSRRGCSRPGCWRFSHFYRQWESAARQQRRIMTVPEDQKRDSGKRRLEPGGGLERDELLEADCGQTNFHSFSSHFGHFSCCRCMRCTHTVQPVALAAVLFRRWGEAPAADPAAHQACALVVTSLLSVASPVLSKVCRIINKKK